MRRFTVAVLAVAVGLGAAASPFAASSPDGLARVAKDHGFANRARVRDHAPAPGYGVPGVGDPRLATGLAGFGGTLLVFGLAGGAGAVVRRRGTAS